MDGGRYYVPGDTGFGEGCSIFYLETVRGINLSIRETEVEEAPANLTFHWGIHLDKAHRMFSYLNFARVLCLGNDHV